MPDGVAGANFTIKMYLRNLDANQDGAIDETEYDNAWVRVLFTRPAESSGLIGIRPGGVGDVSAFAIAWTERGAAEVPAPLAYRGQVYMIANGGILTCVDARTGKRAYRARIDAPGAYYSSPVAAGGKVFVGSSEGILTVLAAGKDMNVLSRNDLGEPIFATPALAGSRLYVRTTGHLWAFGNFYVNGRSAGESSFTQKVSKK